MGPILRRAPTVRKKKQDTPLKTGPLRKTGLKKQMWKRTCEVLPEEGELHVRTARGVPSMVPQTVLVSGAESSDDSSQALVTDTSCSSDEQLSLVDTSSTLPSPEVFREEKYCLQHEKWEPSTFPVNLTDSLIPKNSTLLDLSHAETIHMHSPPNLSTIMDAPTILLENAENGPQDLISNQKLSDNCKILKAKTPPPVWFRSPLFSEKRLSQSAQSPKPRSKGKMRKRGPSSPQQNIEPEEMNTEEKEDVAGGVFFDFASISEQESYFSKMKERCSKLSSAIIIPLTAARGKRQT